MRLTFGILWTLALLLSGVSLAWVYQGNIVQFASSVKSRLVVEEIVVAEDSRVQKCDVQEDQVVCSTTQSLLNGGAMGQEGLKNIFPGENNFELVGNVEKGSTVRRLSRGVGRLDFIREDGSAFTCTGFLISEELLLTAGHCVKKDDGTWKAIRSARMRLGYYEDNGFQDGSDGPNVVKLDLHYFRPSSGEPDVHPETAAEYKGPRDLDYALLGLLPGEFADNVTNAEDPVHRIFGPVDIARVSLEPDHELVVLQHPRGDRMMLTRRYCRSAEENDSEKNPYPSIFDHRCDTLEGSSGAPVFSRGHEAVTAIHLCCKGNQGSKAGTAKTNLNYALHLEAVANDNETVRKLMIEEPITAKESREMLSLTSGAQNLGATDTVTAFRLSSVAFQYSSEPVVRKTLYSAASAIGLGYQERLTEYSVFHRVGDSVLLRELQKRAGVLGWGDRFEVRKGETSTEFKLDTNGGQVWLVTMDDRFRILAESVEETTVSPRDLGRYSLFDHNGVQIGEPVEGLLSPLSNLPINASTAVVLVDRGKSALFEDRKQSYLFWNLREDIRKKVDVLLPNDLFNYQDRLLDVSIDRRLAHTTQRGLALIDSTGELIRETTTEVDLDPAFVGGEFSPDGAFFALRHSRQRRLGVWNPEEASFLWLDPDGWVINAYTWSKTGHKLAFSGRTVNQTDVTVEVMDASDPSSRTVVYSGNAPIQSIAFVAGGEQLAFVDKKGHVYVLDLASNSVVVRGKIPAAFRVDTTGNDILTSAKDGTFVSSIRNSPSKGWSFVSDDSRTFAASVAADKNWKYHAVPFLDRQANQVKLEVRSVNSGKAIRLDAIPDLYLEMKFSPDSKWLGLISNTELWLYSVEDWNVYKFTSDGHGGFEDMEFEPGVLKVKTYKDKYVVIDLTGAPRNAGVVPFDKKDIGIAQDRDVARLINGWDTGESYEYRSEGILDLKESGWAAVVRCRDQALGARDCDVSFVPSDAERLISFYDKLIWAPSEDELERLKIGSTAPF